MSKKPISRIVLILCVISILFVVAVPVANLFVGLPESPSLANAQGGSALRREALGIMAVKCANCHTEDYILPWYAKLPPAKGIIGHDIAMGQNFLDMPAQLADPENPVPGEVALAKVEHTLLQGTMPPLRYLALHWDGGLSEAERDTILAWIRETRAEHHAAEGVPAELADHVVRPLPEPTGIDARKAELGELLFHDERLSGDNTLSCASCHDLAKGGTDQLAVSVGIDNAQGPINSPTVFNAVYNHSQFWDGRAADLQEQAGGPVENPIEMGATFPEVIEKLNADAAFRARFEAVYPEGFTKENITGAIAEFEKTLVTTGSAFDRYLLGGESALGAGQKAGYELFLEIGCATCHAGEALGGQSFEKMGRFADYFAQRGGALTEADHGRYNHTQAAPDKHHFKVPVLRNVALTHPYFHDAAAKTLAKAVRTMAEVQLDEPLPEEDVQRIVAFLESLTGTYRGTPLDEL